jgi:hypothetical protein
LSNEKRSGPGGDNRTAQLLGGGPLELYGELLAVGGDCDEPASEFPCCHVIDALTTSGNPLLGEGRVRIFPVLVFALTSSQSLHETLEPASHP